MCIRRTIGFGEWKISVVGWKKLYHTYIFKNASSGVGDRYNPGRTPFSCRKKFDTSQHFPARNCGLDRSAAGNQKPRPLLPGSPSHHPRFSWTFWASQCGLPFGLPIVHRRSAFQVGLSHNRTIPDFPTAAFAGRRARRAPFPLPRVIGRGTPGGQRGRLGLVNLDVQRVAGSAHVAQIVPGARRRPDLGRVGSGIGSVVRRGLRGGFTL